MDILIRRAGDGSGGQAALVERAIETDSLSVGSAIEQDLHLNDPGIAEQHAVISQSGELCEIACRRGQSLLHNGTSTRKATLSPGDVVLIGDHRLDISEPPAGFDLALNITHESHASAAATVFRRTRLADTWLAPRAAAWVMSLAVLAICLAFPLAHYYTQDAESAPQSMADSGPASTLQSWLMSDRLWSSGPLHEAHAALEDNCGACHVKLFQQVTDASCENCHEDTLDHVSADAVQANAHLTLPMNSRCAGCHKEHNEPVSTLIDDSNQVCTDCHSIDELSNPSGLMDAVVSFGTGTHPNFDVSVLRRLESLDTTTGSVGGSTDDSASTPVMDVATGRMSATWIRKKEPLSQANESSGLLFNHEVHANVDKVSQPGGAALECGDCHTLSNDKEHFEEIAFEANCATSGCHQLELDQTNRIPHAEPAIAVTAIEGYYLKKFGNPDAEAQAPIVQRRRRPDQGAGDDGAFDERFDCVGSSYECALAYADRKVAQQFTKTGCITCHVIEETDAALSFAVVPVKLNDDYHPAARFDHGSHKVLIEPGKKTAVRGDAACIDCHRADVSIRSEELMMPGIDNCTRCHNGPERVANVPLGCVDCHQHHPASSSLSLGKES